MDKLIDKLSLDEIEKYLELLVDQMNATDKKIHLEKDKNKKNELQTLWDSKYELYEKLFERCRELCRLAGKPGPKFFNRMTIEQLDREFRRG